ncbi:MAG: nuclease domain-containing protein [Methanothermobacter sp.]|uniref:nuclease domain-containing protein n=1 Tax=Methanothermobacter tenebrarum TaxID=680118 RepID=UPI0024A70902|nr:nuclease domain-containing protein [Methanothermobacter tenebrarum]MDD3454168.1 nuclease domain-containing protein [Methanobacteriales archaeon]MDX9693429.1 nuclease domain-containing protein [Methanothermobacter sp.]
MLEDITSERVDPREIFDIRDWKVNIRKGNSILSFRMGEDRILLSYNGRFGRSTRCRSYSLPFKPDYSILVDVGECTYFIHLDAKYRSTVKVEDFYEDIDIRDSWEELEKDYKDGDVYKMHTYKDAILHSRGAYILYPGSREVVFHENGEHEIPSVGAFPLNPAGSEDEERRLRNFLEAVIRSLMER